MCDHINQIREEYNEALLSTINIGKGLHKLFKAFFNKLS